MIVGADNRSFETCPFEVYEFAFIGGPPKIRGGDAAPLRPEAMLLRWITCCA